MRVTKRLSKNLLVFICFTLIVSWGSIYNPSNASAASSDLMPMGQPVEQVVGGTAVVFDDTDEALSDGIPIGFDFYFYGKPFDHVYAATNGYLMFEDPVIDYQSYESLPLANIDHYIAPFFDDFDLLPNSKVVYKTVGEEGQRKFIIQYTNMAFYYESSPFGTFQVILYEENNEIQFQYPNIVGHEYFQRAFGGGALIGIQRPSGIEIEPRNVTYSHNDGNNSITEKQAIRFTPDGPLEYEVVSNVDNQYATYDERVVNEPILLSIDVFPGSSVAVSPADGSYTSSNHTFQWSAAIGATSYRLLIAEDANLEMIVRDESGIGQTSFDIIGLEEATTYYWKVAAVNDAGFLTYSNTYRFKVPFEKALPLNQSVETLFEGVEIDFTNSPSNDPRSVVVPLPFEFQIYNSQYSEIEISDDGYYWFNNDDYKSEIELMAYLYDGKVLYATLGEAPNRKFVIQYTNSSLYDDSFGTFQLLLYESDQSIQFQYPILFASEYGYSATQIKLKSESNINDDNWRASYYGRVTEKRAIRFSPNSLTNYVVTKFADYDPLLLVPDDFPAPSTLLSPADGSSSSTNVNFEWENTNGAFYTLYLATDSNFSLDSLVDVGLDPNEFIMDTSHTVNGLEEGLVYYWKVMAVNYKGYTISNTYRFTVPLTSPLTTIATGNVSSITSMTATAGGNVTANGAATVAERGIVYALNADPSYNDTKVAATIGGAGDFTVDLASLQPHTTYHARAYAISEGNIVYGQEVTFTTLGSPASLNALSLSGITLDQLVSGHVYSYTASVPNTVSSTAVTATVQEADYLSVTANVYNSGNILVHGPIDLVSGVMSSEIPLDVGSNKIEIVVLALDDSGTTYTVTVTRAAAQTTPPSGGGGGGEAPRIVTSKNGKFSLPIGRAGEVSLNDEIVITIPANASKKQLELTIEKVLNTQDLLSNREILASSVFEVLKNFTENFDKTVTITITFDPSKLKNGQTAAIFYYDEVKKTWVKVEGGKISKDRISVGVNHFTKFAVLVVDEKTGLPVLEQSTGTTTDPTTEVKFSDIEKHWAEASIKQAVISGIVKGYTDGTFKPNATVTRAEFAVMLMNTLKPQGDGADLTFTDHAKIGTWAQKAVAQAVQAGIIKGYQDGSFRPNSEVTRAEMAVMIANALGQPIVTNATTSFADDKDIPAWAKGSVTIVKQVGIVQGKSDNKFSPQDNATRAEAVTVLLKLLAHKNK